MPKVGEEQTGFLFFDTALVVHSIDNKTTEVLFALKIGKLFDIKKTQYELDFVDIDPEADMPLFLDPYYISKCEFPFAENVYESIRSYFEYLLRTRQSITIL